MKRKKYACNRLYIDNRYLSQAVVTINEDGEVGSYFSLYEEISATEWIGGAVVLSDKKNEIQYSNFQDFKEQMTNAKLFLYAWHISNFDFQKEEFTPQSIISRL